MTERMKTWIKGFAGGVAVTVIVGGIGYFICFGSVPMIGEQGLSLSDLGKASKIAKLVDTYYLDYKEGDEDSQYTMEEGMYSGLVASLQDPYSSYYSEDAYKLLQESTQGAYTGVGLTMSKDPDSGVVSVVDLAEGGPAEQAGIQKGDILTAVDGKDITEKELSEISTIIREDNKKQVVLTVERDGTTADITVSLEKVEVTVVKSRMLDDSLGYIQITEFTDGTSEQFKKAYSELNEQGMKGLLVDLRENPGGLLTAVCDTLEQILPKRYDRVIPKIRADIGRSIPVKGKNTDRYSAGWFWSIENSASAAEIVFRSGERSRCGNAGGHHDIWERKLFSRLFHWEMAVQ